MYTLAELQELLHEAGAVLRDRIDLSTDENADVKRLVDEIDRVVG